MKVEIAARLRPFSHAKRVSTLIPGSLSPIEIFPTLLRFSGKEIELPFLGPIEPFTVQLDLEKKRIVVFGETRTGYMRYFISCKNEKVEIYFEKAPKEAEAALRKLGLMEPAQREEPQSLHERLCLGMHRLQNWDRVLTRGDLREIFPAWLRSAQLLPLITSQSSFYLISQVERAKQNPLGLYSAFSQLLQAHFTGILTPHVRDAHYQGLIPKSEESSSDLNPFLILQESGRLIRSLFIEEGEELALLPYLPKEFHAGRFVDIALQSGDRLSMRWAKKSLTALVWKIEKSRTLHLKLHNQIKSYRLCRGSKERGERISVDQPLLLEAGETLYFDRFQK